MKVLCVLALTISIISLKAQQIKVCQAKDTTVYENEEAYFMAHTVRQGYWIIINEQQRLEEGMYVDNSKQGVWVKYFGNNKKCEEISYVDNRPYGKMIFYHDNGHVREEGTWINNHWVGEYKMYYENGIAEYSWNFDSQGSRTGNQMYFHENGNTMIEGEWEGGKEKGTIVEYFEDGSIKSEKKFNAGIVDSNSVKIYEPKALNQSIKSDSSDTLKQFKGNGYYCTKNKSNKKDYEGVWKNGKYQDGQKFIYDDNGTLTKILIYRGGMKVGEKQPE